MGFKHRLMQLWEEECAERGEEGGKIESVSVLISVWLSQQVLGSGVSLASLQVEKSLLYNSSHAMSIDVCVG